MLGAHVVCSRFCSCHCVLGRSYFRGSGARELVGMKAVHPWEKKGSYLASWILRAPPCVTKNSDLSALKL